MKREALRLGGAVSGWVELEQQLPAFSVPLSSAHTLSSDHLDGSTSTACAKLVLLKRTLVQLNGTCAAPPI